MPADVVYQFPRSRFHVLQCDPRSNQLERLVFDHDAGGILVNSLRRAHFEVQCLKRESFFLEQRHEEPGQFRREAQILTVLYQHSGIEDLRTRNLAFLAAECLSSACRRQLDLQHRRCVGGGLVFAQVSVNDRVVHRLFDDDVPITNGPAHPFANDAIRNHG